MRVTNNYQTRTLAHNSQQSQAAIAKLQAQIASGKSIMNPSDDPAAAGKTVLLNQSLGQMDQYSETLHTLKAG